MSNILKFILMAVAWLLFTAVTFYTCVKPQCCEGELAGVVAPPTAVDDDYAIYSTLGASTALAGADWPALRERLVRESNEKPGQTLEVFGTYYASEPKPAGYENMGFLRADRIKDILVSETDIPADRIATMARLLDPPAPTAGNRFSVGQFRWEDTDAVAAAGGSELIEIADDRIEIRFPLNASTKRLDDGKETYLQTLAKRVTQSGERVTIVGHTDIRASDTYNMRLGQRRADFVKNRLVSYGAPAGQISTSSKGESQLAARGNTEAAHRRNRRAEITLIRQ